MRFSSKFQQNFKYFGTDFEIFYLTSSDDLGYRQQTLDMIANSFSLICEPEWNYLLENNISSEQVAYKVRKQIGYTVMGALLLYLNRQTPAQYNEFLQHVEEQIAYVLDKY